MPIVREMVPSDHFLTARATLNRSPTWKEMSSFLANISRLRTGAEQRGIYSVCSAHPWVLEAAMRRHLSEPGPLLIEATCNQVNQFRGYTGMTPGDFRDLVYRQARKAGLPEERILLGGDHLGPFPWQHLRPEQAMENALTMVKEYVREGYTKIHLDASMPCQGDPCPLPDSVIASRATQLCAAAESAAMGRSLLYVIGTEVPTPGGAVEALNISVTPVSAAEHALRLHQEAFLAAGLDDAWGRVIALVVQPGVEFGQESVEVDEPERARELSSMLRRYSGLVFEAHSTDYQLPHGLAALVQDGFAILKVGPGLTYAMRQAIFALAMIEVECIPADRQSRLRERIETAMQSHPEQWQKHYTGGAQQQQRLRIHSYSDRIRYYWANADIQSAFNQLIANLEGTLIPETLLSDYLPVQYGKVRSKEIINSPSSLIFDAVGCALTPYIMACYSK
jgi:D-tagatose-1,6-bisphosphate aldolase subunit GatZ/KbaZ